MTLDGYKLGGRRTRFWEEEIVSGTIAGGAQACRRMQNNAQFQGMAEDRNLEIDFRVGYLSSSPSD